MSPYCFFTIIPLLYFILKQRTDVLRYKILKKEPYTASLFITVIDTVISNILCVFYLYILNYYFLIPYVLVSNMISYILGFILFHNQHTYNPSYIVDDKQWNQQDSGLKGSSFIQIPWYLKYFTGGIEYHHIHHMNAKIPGYNLQKYHEEVVNTSNIFDSITKLSMNDCYNNLWLKLYDEEKKRYITFEEADIKLNDCKNH